MTLRSRRAGGQRATRVRYTFRPQDIDFRSRERFLAIVDGELCAFAAELDVDPRTLTDHIVDHGFGDVGRHRAARDLLLAQVSRKSDGLGAALHPDEDALVVTAVSHKAITNMLAAAVEAAVESDGPTGRDQLFAQVDVRVGHIGGGEETPAGVRAYRKHDALLADLESDALDGVGGNAWAWTRPEFREAFDTVVIDEAGQFSLAMALSVATAGRDLILLGDPQQLTQPIQGAHPDGAGSSRCPMPAVSCQQAPTGSMAPASPTCPSSTRAATVPRRRK